MKSILDSINERKKSDLVFLKEGQNHFEEFSKYFERGDRFEKLIPAMELLDSYLGLTEPNSYLLNRYATDIRFRVIFDKLYNFHRNISKRIVNHKLKQLMKSPLEAKIYKTNDAHALSLLDDYKMIYGAPMHKEVFKNDLSEFFTTEEINQWLN